MNQSACTYPIELRELHSFGLQAFAKSLYVIESVADLEALSSSWQQAEQPIILGEGSNTVFVSNQIERPIWKMALRGRHYLGCEGGAHIFKVMAGENWHSWVEWSIANGFPGLENLALIPGSVGAGPVQNIGAYGVELVERIRGVWFYDYRTQKERFLGIDECGFGYRESVFKHSLKDRGVITSVEFALPVNWQPVLTYGDLEAVCSRSKSKGPKGILEAVCEIRSSKLPDPKRLGNSGSFFKNPILSRSVVESIQECFPSMPTYPVDTDCIKLAAGWLIDQCGLRGFVHSGVAVYDKQALILVNVSEGKGVELIELIEIIQEKVMGKFGVQLEPEPNLIK